MIDRAIDERQWLVLEFASCGDLYRLIHKKPKDAVKISDDEKKKIIENICSGKWVF